MTLEPTPDPTPASTPDAAPAATPALAGTPVFDYTGYRFLLGRIGDSYGIWDRSAPGAPIRTYPRTDAGWEEAWRVYATWEPSNQAVGAGATSSLPVTALRQGPRTNGMAIASLVLGIVWLYWIGSVLAVVLGFIALRDIDRSDGSQSGRGLAIAGLVLGFIGIATLVAVIIAVAATRATGLR